jgi:hypothetical protein
MDNCMFFPFYETEKSCNIILYAEAIYEKWRCRSAAGSVSRRQAFSNASNETFDAIIP